MAEQMAGYLGDGSPVSVLRWLQLRRPDDGWRRRIGCLNQPK
jgi:hypothetical protein